MWMLLASRYDFGLQWKQTKDAESLVVVGILVQIPEPVKQNMHT